MTTIDQAFLRAYLQEPASAISPAESEQTTVSSGQDGFRPLLQVDEFAWSKKATRLRLAAGIQMDRLADGLANGIAAGQKVVAIGGCGRRQGCTTLLLSTAKRLADRGLKVAMVDADVDHPALAGQLGLLPEGGLEEVLAGRLPLEEVVIESLADRVSVLPLAAPCPGAADSAQAPRLLAAAMGALGEHYDLVLVDVGDIGGQAGLEGQGDHPGPGWLDAIVLVQDVRSTARTELLGAVRRVAASGLALLGVVENFV